MRKDVNMSYRLVRLSGIAVLFMILFVSCVTNPTNVDDKSNLEVVYMSLDGNDSNNGTDPHDDAVRHLSRAWELAMEKDGAEIQILPGMYTDSLDYLNEAKINSYPIVITAYDDEEPPVFNGTEYNPAEPKIIKILGYGIGSNVVIENIHFTGEENVIQALAMHNVSHCKVRNCEFYGFRHISSVLAIGGSEYCVIEDCSFYNIYDDDPEIMLAAMISISYSNNNIISENVFKNTWGGEYYLHSIYLINESCNNEILNNIFINCTTDGGSIKLKYECNENIINNNTFINSCGRSYFSFQFFHETTQSASFCHNNQFTNNNIYGIGTIGDIWFEPVGEHYCHYKDEVYNYERWATEYWNNTIYGEPFSDEHLGERVQLVAKGTEQHQYLLVHDRTQDMCSILYYPFDGLPHFFGFIYTDPQSLPWFSTDGNVTAIAECQGKVVVACQNGTAGTSLLYRVVNERDVLPVVFHTTSEYTISAMTSGLMNPSAPSVVYGANSGNGALYGLYGIPSTPVMIHEWFDGTHIEAIASSGTDLLVAVSDYCAPIGQYRIYRIVSFDPYIEEVVYESSSYKVTAMTASEDGCFYTALHYPETGSVRAYSGPGSRPVTRQIYFGNNGSYISSLSSGAEYIYAVFNDEIGTCFYSRRSIPHLRDEVFFKLGWYHDAWEY